MERHLTFKNAFDHFARPWVEVDIHANDMLELKIWMVSRAIFQRETWR